MKTPREDDFTSTVDGAEGFAIANCEEDNDADYDTHDEDEDEEDEEDDDRCDCSDPYCPCGGVKRNMGGY